MAMIPLIGGFTVIPEGTHIFQITEVVYKEAFGKLEVKMRTADGQTHNERFTLMSNGKANEGALKAFSFFAKTALNNFSLTEIDPNDLTGHFISCEVKHDVQPNINDPAKTVTFVRLGEKKPADGFQTAEATTATEAPKPAFDLKSILGK